MRIPEHTIVTTLCNVHEGGIVVPVGQDGTIVHVYPSGYEVEFPDIADNPEVVHCPEGSIKPKAGT